MPAVATRRIRGVVFDLWNTLAYNDHRPNPVIALGEAFGVRGQPGWTKILERGMMQEKLTGIEEGIAAISRLTGRRLDRGTADELARLWREACAQTRLFPEVPEILGRLAQRFRLGLLSNTQSFDLEFPGLSTLPIHSRLFSFEMGALKPEAGLFVRMAQQLEMPPREVLMVGDNFQDDVLGAEAVGMQALLIRRGGSPLSFQETHLDREPLITLHPLPELLGD
ncbi:MAG: HAD family hydrolase [Acidobacteria bacterium]|nr:HAD family hydrolase [Acidobacteriota bacterium]MCI0655750.1 HAD family hydrolase [Acidobacteriota bacterium]